MGVSFLPNVAQSVSLKRKCFFSSKSRNVHRDSFIAGRRKTKTVGLSGARVSTSIQARHELEERERKEKKIVVRERKRLEKQDLLKKRQDKIAAKKVKMAQE